jgi:hypothetical protein
MKGDAIDERLDRIERILLRLAARPLPGYDFHQVKWPPTDPDLKALHRKHGDPHTEGP